MRPPRKNFIELDPTILPGLYRNEEMFFGITLRPESPDAAGIRTELSKFAAEGWAIGYRVVSETSPGEPLKDEVFKRLDVSTVADQTAPLIGT